VVLDSSDFHGLTDLLIVYLSIARRLTECQLYNFTGQGKNFLGSKKLVHQSGEEKETGLLLSKIIFE
jgi:hypothetical protein